MEAGDSGARQSGHHAGSSPGSFDQRSREFSDRQHPPPAYSREAPMATATLISPAPTGPYHSHHSSYNSPSLSHPNATNPSTTPSIAGMISPVDSRRTSDDTHDGQPHRQSLPSINDVLSIAKPSQFPPVPPSQTSLPGPPAPLPSPFGSSHPRSFPDRAPSAEKDSSPRNLHPPTDSPFHPRPPPLSLSTYASHQQSPTAHQEHGPPESDSRPSDPPTLSNGYPGPPPPQHAPPYPPAPGPLPASQYPLPGPYPVSPRNPGMPPHSFENRGPYMHPPPQDEYAQRYDATITRGYDFYHMLDYLNRAGTASRTIHSFANHWAPIIREHHGNQAIPARLPRLQEINDMIGNADHLKNSLEHIRELVQQNLNMAEAERRGLEMAGPKGKAMEEADHKPYYPQPQEQVKKRRGRAAPPGRCHSCNRSDTPEWRRGPDGARTLCNACGLHFAKLNKKRQQDNRSLRPKPEPENP